MRSSWACNHQTDVFQSMISCQSLEDLRAEFVKQSKSKLKEVCSKLRSIIRETIRQSCLTLFYEYKTLITVHQHIRCCRSTPSNLYTARCRSFGILAVYDSILQFTAKSVKEVKGGRKNGSQQSPSVTFESNRL